MHWDMDAGARRTLPAEYTERAVYVAAGSAEVAGRALRSGQMAVLKRGNDVLVTATEAATIMLLGGEPLSERFIYWNFVSSSKARLAEAAADWKAGWMKLPDADAAEFIPLPDEPAPPAPAMS